MDFLKILQSLLKIVKKININIVDNEPTSIDIKLNIKDLGTLK